MSNNEEMNLIHGMTENEWNAWCDDMNAWYEEHKEETCAHWKKVAPELKEMLKAFKKTLIYGNIIELESLLL